MNYDRTEVEQNKNRLAPLIKPKIPLPTKIVLFFVSIVGAIYLFFK